ncbi:MAG: hypothetical protein IPM51_11605 [Sphingobacteriaceae bacterium]|nr:hypothetical protein [Sphingobacteriaceae bacterium]
MKLLKILGSRQEEHKYLVTVSFKINEILRKKIRRHFIDQGISVESRVTVYYRNLLFNYFTPWEEQFRIKLIDELQQLEIRFQSYEDCIILVTFIYYP